MDSILFIGLINVLLFYFIWFYGLRNYFIDSHRHELFRLRNNLFNYAIENNINFDHPAFINRWEEINTSIRYSHEIHLLFFTMLMDILVHKSKINSQFLQDRKKHLKMLKKNDQKYFNNLLDTERKLFTQYLVKSSLLLLPLFLMLIVLFHFVKLYNTSSDLKMEKMKTKIKKTQSDIFDSFLATT